MNKDHVNDYFKAVPARKAGSMYYKPRPRITCASGLTLSVQASSTAYSCPREDLASHYVSVEVEYPSFALAGLLDYAEDRENPTDTVYGYVPVLVVNEIIEDNGGIVDQPEDKLEVLDIYPPWPDNE